VLCWSCGPPTSSHPAEVAGEPSCGRCENRPACDHACVRPGYLACPNNCPEGRFEALNAPMFVDRHGRYAGHDGIRATYVCAVCQSVAVDVAAAAAEMHRRGDEQTVTLTCPSCGMRMLPPEDDPLAILIECPACETRFEVEEGMSRLHGDSDREDDDSDD
jgi:DNA-directed RNA polymerase subunit RPC12/RpoP